MPDKKTANFTLVWTKSFLRTARKFLRRHRDMDGLLADTLRQIEENPYAPNLRLHRLSGAHHDKHAVSLTYQHRIVLTLAISSNEIILLDIGSHDEVYQ